MAGKSIIDVDVLDLEAASGGAITFERLSSSSAEQAAALDELDIVMDKTMRTPVQNLESLTNCPRCGKPLVPAQAINEGESISFLECASCGTLINTFRPTAYQARFLQRTEVYKMTAGGFGTGKSRVDIEDVIKHLLLIKNARVGVFARSYPALDSTFIKDFTSIFPKKLLRRRNDQKHEMQLTNGAELLFRSFDDPNKLKSMNLTMAVIIEASDVPLAGFMMVQSRLRNMAATLPELDAEGKIIYEWDAKAKMKRPKIRVDARHISLETNPDSGWVKKFLLDAGTVEFFGDAYNEGYKFNATRDLRKYVQVVSTNANPYLPPTYEEEQTRGKSQAYIQQFYKGSFNFSSNLVFPNAGTCIVAPHKLPREFNEVGRRVLYYLIGLDYGINDPTHVVFAAFSTETKKLYVYYEMRIFDTDVENIAKEYRKTIKESNTNLKGLMMQPRFDGRSYNKRESDLRTIGESFEAAGLFFEPSFAGHDIRIIKMNGLFNHGQIEIFSTNEYLIEELLTYKFELTKEGNPTKKPKDGNDHGITALEFIVVELPHNLQELNLQAYLPAGKVIVHDKKIDDIIRTKNTGYNPLTEDTYVRHTADHFRGASVGEPVGNDLGFSIFDETNESNNPETPGELPAYPNNTY